MEGRVISKGVNTIRGRSKKVIDENEKECWRKYTALRDTSIDRESFRESTINPDGDRATSEKTVRP